MKITISITFIILLFSQCTNELNNQNIQEESKITSLNDIITELDSEQELFTIDPKKDTIIEGNNGTIIYLPANSLVFKNGDKPNKKVNVILKECYSYTTMISNGLATTSGNQLLETGGMINLNIISGNDTLILHNNSTIGIAFPRANKGDTMNIFYGAPNQENIDWTIDYEYANPNSQNTINKSNTVNSNTISPYYTYRTGLGAYNQSLINHPLIGTDLTVEQYIEENQFLSDSIAKWMDTNGSKCVMLEFEINSQGDFINLRIKEGVNSYIDNAALDFFKSFPKLDMKNSGIEYDKYEGWVLGIKGERVYDKTGYITKFRNKYSDFKSETISKMNKSELDYYILTATSLGWINCDKFWNNSEEKIDYVVSLNTSADAKLSIVFSGINSIMNGKKINNKFTFKNVPINQKIKIIGIIYNDGKPSLGTAITKIDSLGYVLSDFKDFTLDELEKEINSEK